MSAKDIFPFGLLIGFGLWWVIFPQTVIRFYTWFHKGRAKMPQPPVIRVIGAAWVVLVSVITLTTQKR